TLFEDEEKKRVLAAIDEKIAGKQIVASAHSEDVAGGGQVIDLMDALRASLGKPNKLANATAAKSAKPAAPQATNVTPLAAKERKAPRRAAKAEEPVAAPTRSRAKK